MKSILFISERAHAFLPYYLFDQNFIHYLVDTYLYAMLKIAKSWLRR